MKKKFDFSGYATKVDLKCADGRVIRKNAFKDNDGQTVPLVWQHIHNDPANVLGHAVLENREDGVYTYCTFNDSDKAKQAKILVEHGDVQALSIHANQLEQKGSNVLHGIIREVSLVLAGANPGAVIDNLSIQHSDGSYQTDDSEAIIYSGDNISLEHSDDEEATMEDVFNTLTDEQKDVVYALLAKASESKLDHSDIDDEDEEDLDEEDNDEIDEDDEDEDDIENPKIKHSAEGGKIMKNNVFEGKDEKIEKGGTLTHDQFSAILTDAQKVGSLKQAILMHATTYGIENIDVLFPDAQTLRKDPDWLKREDDWVQGVLSAISKSPFSRVKSMTADMDFETARAKGYVKSTEKVETYFKMAKRVTTPTTVYVKQKLDRDDIIDVVDFDIVAMVRFQLRTLLEEELATAALVGDGRAANDPYKINEENIRPIYKDDALYVARETLSTKTDYAKMVEEIAKSSKNYKGSGSATFYTTNEHHMNMLWIKDNNGRRIYESDATLCSAMGVTRIVEIPVFEGKTRIDEAGKTKELIGMKVNLKDYNFGADKGGQTASFDDFDIDFNQYKYLLEGRCSGALTKPKSAQIFEFQVVAQG